MQKSSLDREAAEIRAPKPRCFLRRSAVEARTGLSTSEIYRRMAEGTFPKTIHLGPQTVVWDEDEISAWQEAQVAARK